MKELKQESIGEERMKSFYEWQVKIIILGVWFTVITIVHKFFFSAERDVLSSIW